MIDMKDVLFMEIFEIMEMKFLSYFIIILLDLKIKVEMKKFLFKFIVVGEGDYFYLLVI